MMDFVRQVVYPNVLISGRQEDGCVKLFIFKYLLTGTVELRCADTSIGRAQLNQPQRVG